MTDHTTPDAWLLSVPVSAADARELSNVEPLLEQWPGIVAFERSEGSWCAELYFSTEPSAAFVDAVISALGLERPSTAPQPVDNQDWVTLSQAGLAPLTVGRFHVYTPDHRTSRRLHHWALEIPAAQAFGTGHHGTTEACLALLDRLRRRGRLGHVLDVGTGTGILAFAAARAGAESVLATDIDPLAIKVAAGNARTNRFRRHDVGLVAAPGLQHRAILGGAPYDLLIASILARPLITLAPGFRSVVRQRGHIILSGLLRAQEQAVEAAYRNQGFAMVARVHRQEWSALLMRRK